MLGVKLVNIMIIVTLHVIIAERDLRDMACEDDTICVNRLCLSTVVLNSDLLDKVKMKVEAKVGLQLFKVSHAAVRLHIDTMVVRM